MPTPPSPHHIDDATVIAALRRQALAVVVRAVDTTAISFSATDLRVPDSGGGSIVYTELRAELYVTPSELVIAAHGLVKAPGCWELRITDPAGTTVHHETGAL